MIQGDLFGQAAGNSMLHEIERTRRRRCIFCIVLRGEVR